MVLLFTLGAFILGTFAGWAGHWAMHQRWAGPLFRSHMTHHRLYPSTNLTSEEYRSAGKDDSALFLVPVITIVVGLYILALLVVQAPWWIYALVFAISVVIGAAHDKLHEAFHLEGHWLNRFRWFRTLKEIHFWHHRKVKKNMGVIWFAWDRLFGTFKRPSS